MVYSNTTTQDGIIQHIEIMTDLGLGYISGSTDNLKYFNSLINKVMSRVYHGIFMASRNWSYDDSSYTDLPVATTDLVNSQNSYALPETALTVKRVEIKDQNGNWFRINPLPEERVGIALDEFMDVDSQPLYYSLKSNVITLYPASNYSQADSLKIYFDRVGLAFQYNDTTDTPGFASNYHEIVPLKTAIEWYKIKQPQSPTLQALSIDEQKIDQAIKEFYGVRFKDKTPRIGRAKQCFK